MNAEKQIVTSLKKGTILFRQGESSDALYIIKSGSVHLVKELSPSKLETVCYLGPKEFVGELDVFEERLRSLTAVIHEDVDLVRIGKNQISKELKDRPEWVKELMGVLCKRLHSTEDIISKHKIHDENAQGRKNLTSIEEAQILVSLRKYQAK